MAHGSTLLPHGRVCSYTGFLTEERRKEKGALFTKVMFVLIVHKKEVPAGSNPGERIYNHSVKPQHPLLERNPRVLNTLLKYSEPALTWCVCVCVCVRARVRVCVCSVSVGNRLVLCGLVLQAALPDDGQRVGLRVEDPVLQREEVIVGEEEVQILECL